MLGLERQSVVLGVPPAAFAQARAVEKVAAVELHTRLGRGHLQHPPRVGLIDRSDDRERSRWFVEHPVVVVALAELQLLVGAADPGTDRRRLPKIERRTGYGP